MAQDGKNLERKPLAPPAVQADMKAFHETLRQFREEHYQRDNPPIRALYEDSEYDALLQESDFARNDVELQDRIYPSLEQMRERHKRRKAEIAQLSDEGNWKQIRSNYVGLREFREDHMAKARIKKLKTAEMSPAELKVFEELREELRGTQQQIMTFFYGSDGILRIAGMVMVLLAARFFYATTLQAVLKEPGRLAFTALIAVGLLAFGHYTLSRQKTLGSAVYAAGVLVAMLSVFLLQRGIVDNPTLLIDQKLAFGLQLAVAAGSLGYAYWRGRKYLMLFSLVTLFFVPLMVREGSSSNYLILLNYMLAVNVAAIVIAYVRDWMPLAQAAYILTHLFFVGWLLLSKFTPEMGSAPYLFAVLYLTVYYMGFLLYVVLHTLKPENPFTALEYYTVIAQTGVYLGIGALACYWLTASAPALTALGVYSAFSGFFSAFALLISAVLYVSPAAPRKMVQTFLMATVASVSVTTLLIAPWDLIALSFALIGAAALFVGETFKDRFLADFAPLFMLLAIGFTGYSMVTAYLSPGMLPLVNVGFAGAMSVWGLMLYLYLTSKSKPRDYLIAQIPITAYQNVLIWLLFIVPYVTLTLEAGYQIGYMDNFYLEALLMGNFQMLAVLAFREVVHRRGLDSLLIIKGTFMTLLVIGYLFYGAYSASALMSAYLKDGAFWPFAVHYANVALSILLCYLLIADVAVSDGYKTGKFGYVIWLMAIMVGVHTTLELEYTTQIAYHLFEGEDRGSIIDATRRIGYPVLWFTLSVVYLYYGIRYRIKQLRVISMALIAITLAKFMTVDLWRLTPNGRLLAALIIGGLLFGIAEVYQKLRALVMRGNVTVEQDDSQLSDDLNKLFEKFGGKNKD